MAGHRDQTTLFLRGMPRRVVREAKAAAAGRGATLATVVSEALDRSLRASDSRSSEDDLATSMAWFERNRARIERLHHGEYVAITKNGVVDHDVSFSSLAERVFRSIGERPIYMPKVGADRAVAKLRSPRIVR